MKSGAYELLSTDYQARILPIRAQISEAEARLTALRDYTQDDILSAKINILNREIDERTAVGDMGGADALKQERANVQSELVDQQETRAKAIEEEKANIEKYETEIKKVARAVYHSHSRAIKKNVHLAIEEVLDLIDETTEDLKRFNVEVDNESGLTLHDLEALTPLYSEGGYAKKLSERISKYFA